MIVQKILSGTIPGVAGHYILYPTTGGFRSVAPDGTDSAIGSGGGGGGTATGLSSGGSTMSYDSGTGIWTLSGGLTVTTAASFIADLTCTGDCNVSGLYSSGPITSLGFVTGANLSGTNTGDQTSVTGNAGTATTLQTPRAINGVSFNGSAPITVTADASTLTGTVLKSTVLTSSLTSVGALTGGSAGAGFTLNISQVTVSGVLNNANGGAGNVTGILKANGTGGVSAAVSGTDYQAASGGGLVIATGKTFTANNTLTLAGTDGTTMTFPGASASIGYLTIPSNPQSANYTAVLADSGTSIDHPATDANARTFTIPANASVPYPVGTCLTFSNMTSQAVTIAITSDTLYLAGAGTTGSRTLAQYGVATARKLTSTTWIIGGTNLT